MVADLYGFLKAYVQTIISIVSDIKMMVTYQMEFESLKSSMD